MTYCLLPSCPKNLFLAENQHSEANIFINMPVMAPGTKYMYIFVHNVKLVRHKIYDTCNRVCYHNKNFMNFTLPWVTIITVITHLSPIKMCSNHGRLTCNLCLRNESDRCLNSSSSLCISFIVSWYLCFSSSFFRCSSFLCKAL